ncbi:MAG: hypothetical protein F4Y01_03895, partial [Gammaproteobacteria bacterium]|nr:hypothetical protein [Gammaproteobacteria bacterium]
YFFLILLVGSVLFILDRAMLMSVMQAPAAKLVRTLNGIPSKLVRTMAAVGEQRREEAGEVTARP